MTEKNYYQILGVVHDAEDFVIRAAYKALAQRYHPDKYRGAASVGEARMQEIQEAYQTLSDSSKRREYDEFIKTNRNGGEESSQQNTNNENPDWSFAVEYHPHLKEIESNLRKFSAELSESFKSEILESKQFNSADGVAKKLEREFFEERFGTSERVISYAKELLLEGHQEAAREFNQALIMFGDDFDFGSVSAKINKKYRPHVKQTSSYQEKKKHIELSEEFLSSHMTVEKASKIKGISEDNLIKMIRDGFYKGSLKNDVWYIHIIDVSESQDKKTKPVSSYPDVNQQKTEYEYGVLAIKAFFYTFTALGFILVLAFGFASF